MAIGLTADPVAFKKTKHILRHAYEVRDRVLRRIYRPEYVDTALQLADVLTKGLRVEPHERFLNALLALPLPLPSVVSTTGIDGGGVTQCSPEH